MTKFPYVQGDFYMARLCVENNTNSCLNSSVDLGMINASIESIPTTR